MARRSTILGRAALERKLKRMPVVAKKLIRRAMEQSADEIVALMRSLAPVDSGALRDSIGWTWGRAPSGSIIAATVKSSLGSELTITIYAGDDEAFWARWVEFGRQDMPAQPYFYVSYRAKRRRVKSRISRSLTKAAKQVAAGG
ncbi:HK97 gp10 family phage protein [Martelella lutilitoris]|uniref:HK97 gp10 family phage protein n=1 Tax=Martelella lutilitoris TaxID=2583532 RepID=A0A5C4JQ82_9HYPH|nr:HK97-gp10 family putative phage morphogenesis protein [Martelella lutilitoris]TNB46809.1 HK97 gp10 family phage protein [Martelella lutilitoris]